MPDAPHTKASVIARVEREYRALDAVVRRLTARDLRAPAFVRTKHERWDVKDALAHVVMWKRFTVLSLRRERRPVGWRGLDLRSANAKIYRYWRRRSARDVLAEHRRVHREALRALGALPDEWFAAKTRAAPWPVDLVGHSSEHRVRHIETAAARASSAPTSSTRRRSARRRPARPGARRATARRARS